MKIRTRLTLLFTVLVATMLLIFASVIYWSSSQSREREFYRELQKEAITKANLFLETQVSPQTLHDIYLNNRQILNEVEVAIYDLDFNLLYHDAVEIDMVKETRAMVDTIKAQGSLHFYQDQWQVVGLKYSYKGKHYIITATAYDEYGYKKLQNLFATTLVLTFSSLLFIFVLGYFFSKRALKPVMEMTAEVNKITATNLDLRLKAHRNKDELFALAETFNAMLDRLESSFDAQKQFVSNISHELRTPLAAIIAELELALSKEKEAHQYIRTIENALMDSRRIVRLSNSLLDFAKASYDPSEIVFKTLRIDEVLLDACQQVQKANPNYKFNLSFSGDFDDESLISTTGNPYLLQVAFVNLLENACKFSDDHQCEILISSDRTHLAIEFKDRGMGIDQSELEQVFIPFYRGGNPSSSPGNGIGLPLTKKIIALHRGAIELRSQLNVGTTFTVKIPHI